MAYVGSIHLMAKEQEDRHIDENMRRIPGLVFQLAADDRDRNADDGKKQEQAEKGFKDVLPCGKEGDELRPERHLIFHRIARYEQDGMEYDEAGYIEAELSMKAVKDIEAIGPLHGSNAADEDELDQNKELRDEAKEPSYGDESAGNGAEEHAGTKPPKSYDNDRIQYEERIEEDAFH
jgi:hypothetical protein